MKPEDSIAYDDLYYTSAHTFAYDGKPYTGVTIDYYDNGQVRYRVRFQNGLQHGIAEEFFATGAQRKVTPYVNGAAHGRTTEWYADGQVRIERDNEFGIMTWCREFDPDGTLTREYVRPAEDPMMSFIERRRHEDGLPESHSEEA